MTNPAKVTTERNFLFFEEGTKNKEQTAWNYRELSKSAVTNNIPAGSDSQNWSGKHHTPEPVAHRQGAMAIPQTLTAPDAQAARVGNNQLPDDFGPLSLSTETRAIEELTFSHECAKLIFSLTANNPGYIYFGSMVLFLHGGNVSPSDIDIMCTAEAQRDLCTKLSEKLKSYNKLKYSKVVFFSIDSLNIPQLYRIKFTRNKYEVLLNVELNLIEPDALRKINKTITAISSNDESFNLYAETSRHQLNDMIIRNDSFREIYLVDNYFQNLPPLVQRSVLFNQEQNKDVGIYEVITRALMHAKKSNDLKYSYRQNKNVFTELEDLLEKLQVSVNEVLKVLRSHPDIEAFKDKVLIRLEKGRDGTHLNERTGTYIKSLIALLDE